MPDKTTDDLATRLTAIAEGAGGSITPSQDSRREVQLSLPAVGL